ncbi:hypothetical protein [Streptomyces palmae]|uniref:Uncharacterized protein n=1 Tax=Streptomyces palmae TaxID=1701085 RepID=A0A4Z0HFT7_9ACTN|nr:hypothetical protein [Streptomyces palmae]TGB14593.1 hypothetical protein E4099_08110 [Streptomyces palmae]
MTSRTDQLLARARIATPPATDIQAAEARIAARLSASSASCGTCCPAPHCTPAAPPPPEHLGAVAAGRWRGGLAEGAAERMAQDLRTLCEALIARPGALTDLRDFLARRLLEPPGARVLGCILHLADHPDSAQFWWQYAAGAGDPAAAYCLYLHHMSLGEDAQAHGWLNWWHEQACAAPAAITTVLHEDGGAEADHEMAVALRVLRALTRERKLPAAAVRLLDYVPTAVEFTTEADLDLPLPEPDFAHQVKELTAEPVVAYAGSPAPGRETLPERRVRRSKQPTRAMSV